MRHELDPIRHTPLPDSFERTAAWLREPPPPAAPRRAPVAVLAALLIFVAACSWPVLVSVPVGSVVEAVSADRVGLEHPALRLLERLDAQHRVELQPMDAAWEGGTMMRFAVAGRSDTRAAKQWADSLASVPGVRTLRVVQLDATERERLGVVAVRRLFGAHRALSADAVRAELDRAFAHFDLDGVNAIDSVRVIPLAEGIVLRFSGTLDLGHSDDGTMQFRLEGKALGSALERPPGAETAPPFDFDLQNSSLDGLPPGLAAVLHERARARHGAAAESDSVRGTTAFFSHRIGAHVTGKPADSALAAMLAQAGHDLAGLDSSRAIVMENAREIRLGDDVVLRLDASTTAGRDSTSAPARIIVLSRILRDDLTDSLALPPGFHIDTVHVSNDSL